MMKNEWYNTDMIKTGQKMLKGEKHGIKNSIITKRCKALHNR